MRPIFCLALLGTLLATGCQREAKELSGPAHIDPRVAFLGEYSGHFSQEFHAWPIINFYEADTTFALVLDDIDSCVNIAFPWQHMLLGAGDSLTVHADYQNSSEIAGGELHVSGDTTYISLHKNGWSPTFHGSQQFEGFKVN